MRGSVVISTSTPGSSEFFPFSSAELMESLSGTVTPPVVNSLRLLALNELTFPETTALPVNALWFATRWIMSNGAMTCPIRSHVR